MIDELLEFLGITSDLSDVTEATSQAMEMSDISDIVDVSDISDITEQHDSSDFSNYTENNYDDEDIYNEDSDSRGNSPSFQRHGCWEDCGNKTHDTLVAVRIVKTGS